MKNLIKKILFPDEARLEKIFSRYGKEFNKNYPVCFDAVIEALGRSAIHANSITELKSLESDVKFVISAKKFYSRRLLHKNAKMVDLKLSIDKMVEDALK